MLLSFLRCPGTGAGRWGNFSSITEAFGLPTICLENSADSGHSIGAAPFIDESFLHAQPSPKSSFWNWVVSAVC